MPKKQLTRPTDLAHDLIANLRMKMKKEDAAVTRGSERVSAISGYLPTGCFPLNVAIGKPGLPKGRITVLQGKEQGGKSTVAMSIAREVQRAGGIAVYIDAEYKFEIDRAVQLGLYDEEALEARGITDQYPLIITQPEHMNDVFDSIKILTTDIRSKNPDVDVVFIWDSVASTPTKEELEGSAQPGVAAKRIAQEFRKMAKFIGETQVVLLCINQEKEKIGGFKGFGGESTTTIAEKPLAFHATVRMVAIKIKAFGSDLESPDGILVEVRVKKNQIAPPFRRARFDVWFAGKKQGIDNDGAMLELALKWKILTKSGAFYKLKGSTDKFSKRKWPKVDDRDEIILRLEEEAEKRRLAALGEWDGTAAVQDDEDDDGEDDVIVSASSADDDDDDDEDEED